MPLEGWSEHHTFLCSFKHLCTFRESHQLGFENQLVQAQRFWCVLWPVPFSETHCAVGGRVKNTSQLRMDLTIAQIPDAHKAMKSEIPIPSKMM